MLGQQPSCLPAAGREREREIDFMNVNMIIAVACVQPSHPLKPNRGERHLEPRCR